MSRSAIRWDTLTQNLQGALLLPDSHHYDTARRVWNGMIDRRPAAIAVCTRSEDVVAAVRFAAAEGLKVTVRGGGHGVGGQAVQDQTLLVDLAGLRGVTVDARRQLAAVGGGALWQDLDTVAGAFGLATTGGMVSSTGVGGLTLGGGIGWLARKHGLASDNVGSAEVVLANGDIIRANDAHHADLFRALRGGGGRLGIVTEFEFRLHPLSNVLAGGLWCRAERAAEVLRAFRTFAAQAPDELTMVASALIAPPAPFVPPALRGVAVMVIGCCWCGDLRRGEQVLASFRAEVHADADLIGVLPYPLFQSSLDATAPHGVRNYWRSLCLKQLDDAAIDWLAESCMELPTPMSMIHIHQLGGAITRGNPQDAAGDLREYAFVMNVVATWPSASQDGAVIEWVRRRGNGPGELRPGRAYVNFSGSDATQPEVAFDPRWLARTQAAKKNYDPERLFV